MKYLLFFTLLLISETAFCQKPYAIHLDKSSGLPCNEIYNLYQDKRGYIWIASDQGLYRYDGFEYKGYFTTNMSSKSGSYIHEDEKGRIWYSSFDAILFYVENDSLRAFTNENGLSQNVEYAIIGNRIITMTRDLFLVFTDINTGKLIKKISGKHIYTSFFQLGSVFGLGDGNVVDFFDKEGTPIRTIEAQSGHHIYKIESFQGKYYSLETKKNNLSIYEIDQEGKKLIYNEIQNTFINGFCRINNFLYILKKDGITRFDIFQKEAKTDILKGISTSHIILDNRGYLWISSPYEGIFVFPSSGSLETYDLPLVNSKIRTHENEFLLFNSEGVIYSFNLLTNQIKNLLNDKNRASIYDIVPFEKGELDQLSEDENITNLQYKNKSFFVLKSGLKEIQKIDSKYIATASTGSAGMIPIKSTSHSIWDSLSMKFLDTFFKKKNPISNFTQNTRTKSVIFDSINQLIYFASNVGVIAVSPKKITELFYQKQKIYASKVIHYRGLTMFYLNSGDILSKTNFGEVKFDEKLNLKGPYQFVKQQDSLLFVGTSKELFYINLNHENVQYKSISFPKLISELNDIVYSRDHFYLTVKNLLIKIPKQKGVENGDIPFYINYIESKRGKYYTQSNLKFNPNERDIKINFSALDYFQNSPTILYSINNGIWRKTDANTRTISLASLSPDDYSISFSVNGKIYNEIIQFSIEKEWYLRWWFTLLLALTLLFAIYQYYQSRLLRSQKQSDLQLEKANLEKDLRQSMLSGIKSQMNPHFLFNALNTIQSYIITEDKTNASNYLSKFSKLTRKILEMSDQETVSLHEEMDALVLYLELEKMRFPELNYTIELDKEIQVDKLSIPSMIIQPYVENAIKHGLLHSPSNKQLFINIKKQNQFLIIKIEDNGVGRSRSGEINMNKGNRHQSFASSANMKRVELLNMEKNEIGIEYIDINENGQTGTIVNIKIPINNLK